MTTIDAEFVPDAAAPISNIPAQPAYRHLHGLDEDEDEDDLTVEEEDDEDEDEDDLELKAQVTDHLLSLAYTGI
jgi:hypothetical protein